MANPKKIPYLDHTKCYGCKCCLFDCPVNAFDLIHPITKRGMRRTLPEFVRKEDCIGFSFLQYNLLYLFQLLFGILVILYLGIHIQ